MTPSETSRDTLHPGTGGYVPNDFALRGAFGGWGYDRVFDRGYEGNGELSPCGRVRRLRRGWRTIAPSGRVRRTTGLRIKNVGARVARPWGLGQSPKRR